MPIEDSITPCCNRIPELVYGSWEPHAPNVDCRTAPKKELPLLPGWEDYVDEFSDADPGL